MRNLHNSIVLAAVFALAPITAFAEQVDVKANSGMQAIYTFALTYEDTCNSAPPPRFKIRKQPSNGRIIADIIKTTFPADHKRCAGKPVQVFAVGYQPKRGFRGKDEGSVSIRYNVYSNESIGAARTLRFNITVK